MSAAPRGVSADRPALPATARAAVYRGPHLPLEPAELPLPDRVGPGAALCRVLVSTICGSDLHTVHGRRTEPAPSILGHESVGVVVRAGKGLVDGWGEPLPEGTRVSWTIMACCGSISCRNRSSSCR